MDDLDEFDEVFAPFTKLREKGSIKTGSDEWYINFIKAFFSPREEDFLLGSFLCLGYDQKDKNICNFDTFKDKVEIKENIINQTDKSIVDMNVGDIIKFDVSEFKSIFKLECDPEIQQNTGRINFFTDCVKSLILCLYVKNKFDTTHEKEKTERLKQLMIDTFLNMLVHLSLSPFLVNNHITVDTINFIVRFCTEKPSYGLHPRLYDCICEFLIKNADKPLNLQQQTKYIEKFLNITLQLNDKNIKLSDKIKLVDKDSNIIELVNGKIPEIKEKKLYFKVIKETIILNFNIFDDKDLKDLKVSIDANGNIKSEKKEDQLSSDELNNLNKLLSNTKLFSDKSQYNLICLLLGIYLKRKNKINDIMSKNADIDIKDILKSFFSEMLEGKNKKSIVAEFKNLKAKNIPNGIYSQLAKIAICCDADSQENFWGKNGDDNSSKFLDKVKTERGKLKNNEDTLWNWIQSELFVIAINKKIGSDEKFKTDLENAVTNNDNFPKDRQYFLDLNAFATFLPKILKNYFTKDKIQEILEEEWKNFEIKDDDLEKLYGIDLTSETKTKIIQKFNMKKATSASVNRLKNENDLKKAIATFKKILGENKLPAVDFRNFIFANISDGVLSSKDIDDILNYVDCNKKEDVFQGLNFWNTFNVLKEQPSKKFIDFMVECTPFGTLDQKYLIRNIIILMRKYPDYRDNNEKDGMFKALTDILSGNEHYKNFSEALLKVENIADNVKLDKIIKSITDKDVMNFVCDLISNGIEIKVENGKFLVSAGKIYSNDELIGFLSQDPELNNWLKAIFAKNEDGLNKVKLDEDNKNLAKTNSILLNKEITTLDDLVSKMSKLAAIKNFINNSKNSERLKKIYKPLLDNDNLLNEVKLDKDTVEWCISEISSNVKSGSLIFNEEKFVEIKTSLENWNIGLKNNEKIKMEINWLSKWKYDSKEQNTYKAINYMLSNNMLPVEANCITGYGLHDALANTPDGSVNENFISHIGNHGCVDFEKLYCGNDKCFGVCLFKTIYQLIRTSKGYDENNKEAKKQAIKNVLEGEEDEKKIYQWFRDGLKTFFNKAKEKNQNINIENVLEDVKELDELINNCEIELIFNNDNELTVQEKEKKKENGYDINNEMEDNNNKDIIKEENIIIDNNNNNKDIIKNGDTSNPYTLSVWFGIFLPIIPSIIFVVIVVKTKRQKITGKDIALIIVGLIPGVSAIVFGIMACRYSQNNLAKKAQKDLKDTVNLNEHGIEKNKNENNKNKKINPISSEQNQEEQNSI